MKNFLFISTSLFAFMVSCSTFTDQNELPNKMTHEQDTLKTVETKQLEYNHKVIFSPETGWGYQIFKEDKLYINQPNIPAVPGNNGFKKEEDAHAVAKYIIEKLNNGIFPPTISVEELDSLGVNK